MGKQSLAERETKQGKTHAERETGTDRRVEVDNIDQVMAKIGIGRVSFSNNNMMVYISFNDCLICSREMTSWSSHI